MTETDFAELEFGELLFRSEMIEEEEVEKEKLAYKTAAFTVWQQSSCNKPFGQYLGMLGLTDKVPVSKEHKKKLIQKGLRNAQRVIDKIKGSYKND